jgi:hypothetical protein
MESLYRSILKQAWKITKKHKFLWFFGIFALWLGNGGEMQVFFRTLHFVEDSTAGNVASAITSKLLFLSFFNGASFPDILIGIIFTLIFCIFLLLGVWLVIVSQAAIITSTNAISNKKEVSFSSIWKLATPHFLPVLGLNIISKVLIAFLVFVLLLPVLLIVISTGSKFALLLSILIWVIFLPFAAIISFIIKYAINFFIIKKETFLNSISKAWILFKANWLVSIEMALALLIINFLAGLIIVYITVALVGPYYQIDILTIYAFQNQALGLVFFKILPLVVAYVFVGSLLAVFQTVAWTLLFGKLVSGKRYSKLIRLVSSLSNYMSVDNQITKVSDISNSKSQKIKRRPGRPKARRAVKK